MADEYGFATTEEEFKALINELLHKEPDEKTQQDDARKALSEIIGVDIDKLAALINNNATEQNDTVSKAASVLVDDLFNAQDPNGLQSTYKASELPFGTVITIEKVEFFRIFIPHDDHGHAVWIDVVGRVCDDDAVAELARNANGNVTITHFG